MASEEHNEEYHDAQGEELAKPKPEPEPDPEPAPEPEEEPDPEPESITINHSSYKIYRKTLLGKDTPDREDEKCEFYLLNDVTHIKKFIKIKTSSINFQLNKEHIQNMTKQIEETKELYFPNSIAILEYRKHESDSAKNLIEIIDGHHRIECVKRILKNNTIKKISFWVQIYKTNSPTSIKTTKLFKLYNNVKPFKINFELIDFKLLLVGKLNNLFKKDNFTLIKDSQGNVYRPSIQQKIFCDKLEERLKPNLDANKIELSIDMVDKIFIIFENYNKTLMLNKDLAWFNNKSNDSYSGKSITENQYKIGKDNNCMLGLIKLDFLISQCVNL